MIYYMHSMVQCGVSVGDVQTMIYYQALVFALFVLSTTDLMPEYGRLCLLKRAPSSLGIHYCLKLVCDYCMYSARWKVVEYAQIASCRGYLKLCNTTESAMCLHYD